MAAEGNIETLIGEKSRIQGDLHFSGGLHVDGEIDGSVSAGEGAGIVHVSDSARVSGEIRAPVVVVNGRVDGDIHCEERLELQEKARVAGNIHYRQIEMRLGAEVNGQLVCQDSSKPKTQPAVVKAAEKTA
ncbi:MAG: polymer-forming cytoskeletal protein [Pseudomonadota bacterium]